MTDAEPTVPLQIPRVAPLFPLPDFILFPGAAHFLQIFEPRYLQMVEDQLDAAGYIVMGTVFPQYRDQLPDAPPVPEIAGVGRIVEYREMPNGRYLILLHGQARAAIQEIESDRLYRQVELSILDESDPPPEVSTRAEYDALKEILLAELSGRVEAKDSDGEEARSIELSPEFSLAQLIDLLLMHLSLSAEDLYPIFAHPSVVDRAKIALSHA